MKNLLKPTRAKILADLLITLILLTVILSLPSFGYQKLFLSMGLARQVFGIIFNTLLSLIIYYPLSCGIVLIYNRIFRKAAKGEKKELVFAALFVLLLNPFIYSLAFQGAAHVNQNIINYPCGVQIAGFAENSPARSAGLSPDDTIISADNQVTDTEDSFLHALAGKRPGDSVLIETDTKKFNIQTIENPNNPKSAFLGIKVKQKYCRK